MFTEFNYVSSIREAEELAALIGRQGRADYIAADTEFIRITEYFPKLALLQLNIAGQVYLVDPLQPGLALVLQALLTSKARFLIFSGSEDLEILASYGQKTAAMFTLPDSCCDLQLMAAFAGHSFGRGLYTLVKDLCGIELNKGQTCSDWLQRPLSSEQLSYAVLDVKYLPELFEKLDALLTERNRGWFVAEMTERRAAALCRPDPARCYRAVGGAGALEDADLALLQYLCQKRMEFGQEHDEALNRIITGKALCQLSHVHPTTLQGLVNCGMKWGAVREHGEMILSWIQDGLTRGIPEQLPLPFDYFAHARELNDDLRRLRHVIEHRARQERVMPELLGGKKALYDLCLSRFEGRAGWLERSWRRELLGQLPLIDFSKQKNLPARPGTSSDAGKQN